MSGTMINQVQEWFEAEGGDPLQVRLVNRIDRDTSGILLLSFDAAVHAQVSTAFAERDLSKEYRAICHGIPAEAHGHWREPLGEGPPESIARVVRPDGQQSHTEYEVLETAGAGTAGAAFSLLKISLHTGRQHQIRVHASHHGHPLVGDWVYGPACAELGGQALHSAVLEFLHPRLKRTLRIEAPLPARLAGLWTELVAGRPLTPVALDDEQLSKLGRTAPRPSLRRPSWLSDEEFARLREEAGE
jgi:23S rRNA pseudouridine1911/1915/1917 synthase